MSEAGNIFFVTDRASANDKRILRTCPIDSSCRIEARLSSGDGGIDTITIISVDATVAPKAGSEEYLADPKNLEDTRRESLGPMLFLRNR